MIRSFLMVPALLCLASMPARSQSAENGGGAPSEPFISVSGSAGVVSMNRVEDGRSLSTWDFSPARQYRATVDKYIGDNTTVGLSLGYAPLLLRYRRMGLPLEGSTCRLRCEATADFWSAAASLRVVSGQGLHHILDTNVGISKYGDFREENSGELLGPVDGDVDLTFSLGYGVGWYAAKRLQISLVGDVGFFVHTQSGRDSDRSAILPILQARLVLRSGI